MDLLSVLMHEMGHLHGHEHEDEGVMAETLTCATRVTLLDAAFTDADWLVGLPCYRLSFRHEQLRQEVMGRNRLRHYARQESNLQPMAP